MRCILVLAAVTAMMIGTPAQAQSCDDNFSVEGAPLLTAMNFRASQTFRGLNQKKAIDNLNSAMLAEGFENITVNRARGALTAIQETSGSGREQTLRVTARKIGKSIRVDAIFMIQIGQVADATTIRGYLCRVIEAAAY